MNEQEDKYSGFFCKKCNIIPLIQIIPKKNKIKIFSQCKCCKSYESIDKFIKNKYKQKIIDIKKISNESILYDYNNANNRKKDENKVDINTFIEKFNKVKEKVIKEGNIIKNDLIETYQREIKNVNAMYEIYIKNNNYIIYIIREIINSYKLIQDNSSNILNILNNSKFNEKSFIQSILKKDYLNADSLSKKALHFFSNEFIISTSSISEGFEKKYFSRHHKQSINFIEINDNICASCLEKSDNIILYDLNCLNKEIYRFKAHQNYVNCIIKSNHNNIISCGNDGIKIWPIINQEFFQKYKINKNETKNFLKKAIEIKNINNTQQKNIEPLFILKYLNNDMKKIHKMMNLKDSQILAASHNNIFLFQYLFDEKNNREIQLIKSYPFYDIVDIFIVEKNKYEIIALCTNYNLYLLNIPKFEVIYKATMLFKNKNNLIQINSKELLISEDNFLYLFDINKLRIKLKIKCHYCTDFLFNMNDGTIIQSNLLGISRYNLKTMEELPFLINLNNDDYYGYEGNENYIEKIVYIYKLNNKKIIVCYQNGKIELCNLKFI